MAMSSITITGRNELLAGSRELPAHVTAALRAVAQTTAQRVLSRARANLAAKTKGTGATAKAIYIKDDPANQMFMVVSPGVAHARFSLHTMKRSGRKHTQKVTLNMLPIWIEHGTVKMAPRPYMRPAADAENAAYQRAMEAAALAPVRTLLER